MSSVWIAFQLFALAIASASVALTWEQGRPLRGTIILVSLSIAAAPLIIKAALSRRSSYEELRSKAYALVYGMLFAQFCNVLVVVKGGAPWWLIAPLLALSFVIQVSAILVLRTSRDRSRNPAAAE